MNLNPHPLANLIPPMTDAEYRELVKDMKVNGLREPITLYEGKILDGRHRDKACRELEIEPRATEYGGDDPQAFVVSENLHRRHLTKAQLAEIGLALLPGFKEEAKGRQHQGQDRGRAVQRGGVVSGNNSGNQSDTTEREAHYQAAAKVGVSGKTVAVLDKVAQNRPDLHERIRVGEITVYGAEKIMKRDAIATNAATNPVIAPTTKRGRELANGAKTRVEKAVGTCNALTRGADGLHVEEAATVATEQELAGWGEACTDAIRALTRLRKRIRKVNNA